MLQLPIKRSSRQVTFVNTSPPEERVYLLKSNIYHLPDDAEVAESNLISRYSKRSKTLENICLAEYAAFYDSSTNLHSLSNSDDEFEADDNTAASYSSTPKRRAVAQVIHTFQYTEQDDEKSARQKLMLYLPWRNELTDLRGEFNTYLEHYQSVREQLRLKVTEFEPFSTQVQTAQESRLT